LREVEEQLKKIAGELLVIAAIGAAMAMLGPFGSYALPVATRTVYWVLLSLAGYALVRPMLMAGRWLAESARITAPAGKLIAVTIGCLPLTAIVAFSLERLGHRSVDDGYVLLYAQVSGVGLTITLFMDRFLGGDAPPQPPATAELPRTGASPASAASQRPQLLDRLPPGFGDRIRCLEMEDHYVRVHGDNRSDLLLMRLADAISETAPLPGLQVHRSWWVSLDAVAAQERQGRRTVLRIGPPRQIGCRPCHGGPRA
jgi:hypothetical protein